MLTYAGRVMNNVYAAVQTDLMLGATLTHGDGKVYKITELTNQYDYYGCVYASIDYDGDGDFEYHIKMFSNSDKYFLYASTLLEEGIGERFRPKGYIEKNGTISDIDLDTELEVVNMIYTPDEGAAQDIDYFVTETKEDIKNVEEMCFENFDDYFGNYKS